jgi:hypothetical protein
MKVVYIGGTGEISFSCVLESVALAHDVSVLKPWAERTLTARERPSDRG